MAAGILGPGVQVSSLVPPPADGRRRAQQQQAGQHAERRPEVLTPEPGRDDEQPNYVAEAGRREPVEKPVLEIYPGRNPRPHEWQARRAARIPQQPRLRGAD